MENKETYLQMRPTWEKAVFGSYLILPMKFDPQSLQRDWILQNADPMTLTTADINENVKAMINVEGTANIGRCYSIPRSVLLREMLDVPDLSAGQSFSVTAGENSFSFDFYSSYLYLFHTRVAFLCLGIRFDNMKALHTLCNPGYAECHTLCHVRDAEGKSTPFSLDEGILHLVSKLGLRKFFDGPASPLTEVFTYTLALVPQRFPSLEVMRQATFNLHLMQSLCSPAEDNSEEDLRYVYAVKDQSIGSYRWGCCVSSQTISYIVADAAMDFTAEMDTQAQDGLPVVLLALYEKYTCLRFTELLAVSSKKRTNYLKSLKQLMLDFQAYGTVMPSNLSRWHNVRQIYAALVEVHEIPAAIGDISTKLSILAEHRQEQQQNRNDSVTRIITVFGFVSILASMLTIIQILTGGSPLEWITMIVTIVSLLLIVCISLFMKKE